jgi:glycosyltransferase involved in cell wall biosynthesis
MGIADSVVLTGYVPGELIESLLASAQCFVLPSRSGGFGISLLEAMAAGLPALYTTECHFKELAEAGGGVMFPFGKEALVGELVRVFELG